MSGIAINLGRRIPAPIRVRRNRFTGFRRSERARMPAGFCKLDAMGRALLVGFGLAERLSASALRLSYLCGGGNAGLSAVSGAGRHLLLSRKFTGAATEYANSACGCASRGGAGDETGTAFSYRRLGDSARSHAFDCMDAGGSKPSGGSPSASALRGNGKHQPRQVRWAQCNRTCLDYV
jgi:hypothetical protein